MATYAGLFLRLKDKKTCLPDKLKLAKFAWVANAVHIPNKHQQILDFVCGLLVNRKKHNITRDDALLVWETLDRFLGLAGCSSVVKPSILQAVIDDLRMFTAMKEKTQTKINTATEFLLHILRSTQKLLVLQSVIAFQFENLCILLCVICQLLVNASLQSKFAMELQATLQLLLAVLIKNQKSHLNQVQVLNFVTDKVLIVALKMLDKLPCLKLQEFLLGCLLHLDHQESYAVYLKHTFGEPGQSHIKQVPKSIANVFTALSSHLKEADPSAVSYIPEFMKMFVSHNKSVPRLCYLMLKQLVNMVMPPDDTVDRVGKEDKWRLEVVAQCMVSCHDCDLFSANSDTNDILKWLCKLTQSVLEKHRTSSWFSYMRAVLNLHHQAIEKFWGKILDTGFARANQISKDCYAEQDLFLADLVSTYIKLRRAPDLLSAFLSSLEASANGTDVFGHLPQFYDRLSHMFSEAPFGSLLDMWENLQDVSVRMIELLKTQSDESSLAYTCLHWTFSFYTVLLGNARMFNHQSTGLLGQRLTVLIKQLEDRILLILNQKKEVAKNCPSLKDLLSVWSVAKILLFPKWRGTAEILAEDSDDKMEESVKKLSQRLDSVSKLVMVVQRQNLATVTNQESAEHRGKRQAVVENILEELLDLPPLSKSDVFKVWEDHNNGPRVIKHPVHRFQQFSQMFPLIGRNLSEKLIDKLVVLVVEVLSHVTLEEMNSTHSHGATLFTEVESFLSHPATREVKIFQERLSIAVWKSLLSGLAHSTPSPRKKKMKMETSADIPSLAKVIHFLTTCDVQAEKCNLILSQIKGNLQVLPHFAVMLKVLKKLDLEYLPDINLHCQIGACFLIASLSRTKSHEEFKNLVMELLNRCLSVPNLSRLFECVKPTELLEFILKACSQGSTLGCQLLQVTVQAVMNDYEAVPSMAVYVKKLTGDLSNIFEVDGIIRMKALAWIIKNCQRYVTKSFHIQHARNAALEIFWCMAKFVIKHGLEWFEKSKIAQTFTKKDSASFEKVSKTKKRKLEVTEHGDDLDKQESTLLVTSENLCTKAWCAILECISEILHLWSKDIIDNKFNEHLAVMVAKVLKQVMADLKSDLVSTKTKISELEFITACCHSHLRCNQTSSANSSALTSLSSSLHTDQPSPPLSSGGLCLLPGRKQEEIWTSCVSLCVLDLSKQLRLTRRSEECPESMSLSHQGQTKGAPTNAATVKLSFEAESISGRLDRKLPCSAEQQTNITIQSPDIHCNLVPDVTGLNQPSRGFMECGFVWLDQMETWPASVTAYVNALTAILECSDVEMFRCLLNKMMESLVPPSEVEPVTVYIMMAVWRRLIKSQLLSDDLVQVMFACMYQWLSVITSLVQYHENLKSSHPLFVTLSQSPSLELTLSMHDALRSVLDALSDFVDLGKMLITPRLTLLCLNAGLTFTLACPSDLQALYRLINTLLVHHTNTALKAVPTIIHIANKLISACIELGSADRLTTRPELVKDLVRCAQLITRLLTLLSSPAYKTDLGKVAHNILAEYVISVQRGSVHTSVKRELVQGLYKIMSICDKFRLAALNASLSAGVKDTFKILHQDYEKYHRYSGFV